MKHKIRFIAQQTARLDPGAAWIFRFTRTIIHLVLLASLALLCIQPNDGSLWHRELAEGLFHSVFRVAAVGVSAGLAFDIAAKRRR